MSSHGIEGDFEDHPDPDGEPSDDGEMEPDGIPADIVAALMSQFCKICKKVGDHQTAACPSRAKNSQ